MKSKIKIFQFPACECSYSSTHNPSFTKIPTNTANIENKLNQFLREKNLVSIIATPVTERRHNNGGFDTVSIIYTVIYQEEREIEVAAK